MWLNFKNSAGNMFASNFFLPLRPQYESHLSSVLNAAQGENGKHTFFAALVSAAMKADQYSTFVNDYHFPVDQSLFNQAYQELFYILYDVDADGIENDYDNCPGIVNPYQEDTDEDGFGDVCDNCPSHFNPEQEDTYPPQGNGIGNACECEGNFNCWEDEDVDGTDAFTFKADFGRSTIVHPCVDGDACNGDFSCDGDVDGTDAFTFKSDFGRSSISNPCPLCVAGMEWCSY